MKKLKKLVLLDFGPKDLPEEYQKKLSRLAEKIEIVSKDDPKRLDIAKDTDGLVVKISTKVDKDFIDSCNNLKYISVYSTAFNEIDAQYAAKKRIAVTNIANYCTEAVAEFLFAALLSNVRELERARDQARAKDYSFNKFMNWELKGKTFGVIGLGNIGQRAAELAQGLGLNVIYWSRTRKKDYEKKGIKFVELPELLEKSDIIAPFLAMNSETKGFLNRERLAKIKKDAVIVCLTLVQLVEFDALMECLQKDQFTFITDHADLVEPEKIDLLAENKNFVVYPPVAFRTREADKTKNEILIENLTKFLEGKPQNKVN